MLYAPIDTIFGRICRKFGRGDPKIALFFKMPAQIPRTRLRRFVTGRTMRNREQMLWLVARHSASCPWRVTGGILISDQMSNKLRDMTPSTQNDQVP